MKKRMIGLSLIILFGLSIVTFSVFSIVNNEWIMQAANSQSTYKLIVSKQRGTIYDCNMKPITGNGDKKVLAAVAPNIDAANVLAEVFAKSEMPSIYNMLSEGKPFLLKLPNGKVCAQGINCFEINERYEDEQLCTHIIGYLNSAGSGVSGIELAYDEYLKNVGAEISLNYKVDALGRVLVGEEPVINDTEYMSAKGIELTIDSDIQRVSEEAAKNYMKKGAIVVTDVLSGEIKSVVSVPKYSPNNIEDYLRDTSSPMINRAFLPYNVGSVFKLVSAAAALECGMPPETSYECCGDIDVQGVHFHCFNGVPHGVVNMEQAIAYSCNGYFVNLWNNLDCNKLLELAKNFGFGKSLQLAPYMISESGVLPSQEDISNPKAISNFSFGQGDFMATPLQIASMVSTIANGGIYKEPRLVKGFLDADKNLELLNKEYDETRVISEWTAEKIKSYMISAVEYGTGTKGKPTYAMAGAKTGTAETGEIIDGKKVVQGWFAGFYPANSPKYSIVVLSEDVESGENNAQIFKFIADNLSF